MKKSTTNLRVMNSGLCLVLNDGILSCVPYKDGSKFPPGALLGQTPRCRLIGTRIGDEKTNTFKDMRYEFSWWIFPLTVFYLDEEEGKINVNLTEYSVTDVSWYVENSTLVWK